MPTIPDPAFAGDDGSVDPAVQAMLATYDQAPEARHLPTLALLQDVRVLVPVVAVLDESRDSAEPAPDPEKDSSMATVLTTGRDGRQALLAFTGTAALQRWRPEARPVPVTLRQAARAALDEGAAAVVLDVAGPVVFALEDDDLRCLAAGHLLMRLADGSWAWTAERPGD